MTMRSLAAVTLAALCALAVPASAADEKAGPVRVGYHVNENNAQAQNALRNIRSRAPCTC